jgi:hypothetical protein
MPLSIATIVDNAVKVHAHTVQTNKLCAAYVEFFTTLVDFVWRDGVEYFDVR